MFDFLRIACALPAMSVGNVDYNMKKMLEKVDEAEEKMADIVLFPELSLVGVTCGDLFFQKVLKEEVCSAIGRIAQYTRETRSVLVFGAPLSVDGNLYNCAVVCAGGAVRGIVPKTILSSSREFSERRWFASGSGMQKKQVLPLEIGLSGEEPITLGGGQIFRIPDLCTFGVEIGDEILSPVSPGQYLALSGAEVLLNPCAVPGMVGKRQTRLETAKEYSLRTVSDFAFSSAGRLESTTDVVYTGQSAIAEKGKILAENEKPIESESLIVSDVDLGRIRADRERNKEFSDTQSAMGRGRTCALTVLPHHESASDGRLRPISKLPFVPSTKKERDERCFELFEYQVAGLRKRLETVGGKLVIGVSGGLDSTLALLVSAETVRSMGRPMTDVHGITMPCFGTSERTHGNATALMEALGVTSKEIPIGEAATLHCEDIGHPLDVFDATYENLQARERTQVLMDYAGMIGGFVVGTGDLSELALGWCTYNGDHMSMYGVNASIPKSLIRWMIDAIAEKEWFRGASDILRDILDTPISPELLPPDASGKIAQETESIIGPYALHDFFLYYFVRYGFPPEKIYYLACEAFGKDFDRPTILKWMRTFFKRFFSQQFKRSCSPDGVTLGSVALSPRGDWVMPSDVGSKMWLNRLDEMSIDDLYY